MYLIIDGYNVLKGLLRGNFIGDSERSAFINACARYAKKKEHSVAIVFDGGDFSYPVRESLHGIWVYYSGFESTADQFIRKLTMQATHKDQVVVVSSDREVRDIARRQGAHSIASHEFETMLKEVLPDAYKTVSSNEQAIKLSAEENPELDTLLQEATRVMPIKDESEPIRRKPSKKQQSKKEKRHEQLRKKL